MANRLQQTAAMAMERELASLRKNRRVICIRNIDWNCDQREFEKACRQRLTLAGDVKFLWPAPDHQGRRHRGRVFLGFDTRPDCKAALDQLDQGFDFNGLRVTVQRSGRGSNVQNQVSSVPGGSTAASASTPAPTPAPAPAPAPALSPASAPSEDQPEAQLMDPTGLFAENQLISCIKAIAAAPVHLVARVHGRAPVSKALATLAAATPEAGRILLDTLLSHPVAAVSASSSTIVPVLGAGPIEEPTTSATSCNDTVHPETVAVQSGDATMQSDKEDAESELEFLVERTRRRTSRLRL